MCAKQSAAGTLAKPSPHFLVENLASFDGTAHPCTVKTEAYPEDQQPFFVAADFRQEKPSGFVSSFLPAKFELRRIWRLHTARGSGTIGRHK